MPYKGLTQKEVVRSRELHGENCIASEKKISFFRKFLSNLMDPIIRILFAAVFLEVLLTLGHCNWIEVIGIVLAALVAAGVSTVSEHISGIAFERMQREGNEKCVRVIRDGEIVEIKASELVVGDLLLLARGESAMADGVLIEGRLRMDQSALNGEGKEVEKRVGNGGEFTLDNPYKVFSGSIVTDGEGVLLVERVGVQTFYGMVARDLGVQTRESPLKLRLEKLARTISKIGYVLALFVALAYLFRVFVVAENFEWENIKASLLDFPYLSKHLLHAFTLMITVVVVAVPEGLPMMITVVLSANMKRMLSDNVLVKKLVGIETAGSLNILFTDKTGTLTTGRLSVEKIIHPDGVFRLQGALDKMGELADALYLNARYNTECIYTARGVKGGNTTERAIAQWFKADRCTGVRVHSKTPFCSENKYSLATLTDVKGRQRTFIKGAPERIVEMCEYYLRADGTYAPFDREGMYSSFLECASLGQRVLAVAFSDGERIGRLVFVGLICLKDKLRSNVKSTVRMLHSAGISVIMLTGDSKETARAIAGECGIYQEGSRKIVMDRRELEKISDEELLRCLPDIAVIARAMPQDKVRLVRVAQAKGAVVGMTGDGINDAPSLKLADVGFAMGAGTDIAKDSADIVILDNSLGAIAKSVLYGRTIFHSIRKFITFQLIMNLVACGVSLFGLFFGLENPITVTQMLWINLIMDTLGGLAFASEPPLAHYMKEKPKRREEEILTGQMLVRIFTMGTISLLLCLLFLFGNRSIAHLATSQFSLLHLCAFYVMFVFMGIMQAFCARSDRFSPFSGLTKNRSFLWIMSAIFVIQLLMVYFGGEFFRTTPLSMRELLYVCSISFVILPLDFLRRIFRYIFVFDKK